MDLSLRKEQDPSKIARQVVYKATQVEFILRRWHELVDCFNGNIDLAKKTVFYCQHVLDEGFARVPNANFSAEHLWREVAAAWGISGRADIRNFGTMFISDHALYELTYAGGSGLRWSDTFHCEHTVGNQYKFLEHLESWLSDPLVPHPKDLAKEALVETVACTVLMRDKGAVQGTEENNSRHPFKRYASIGQKVLCFTNGTVRDATDWSLNKIATKILEDDFLGSVYQVINSISEEEIELIRTKVINEHNSRESYHQVPQDMTMFVKMNPFELQDNHYVHHSRKTYDSTNKKYYSKNWDEARQIWKAQGTIPKSLWDHEQLYYPE